jgi:moderate conductance mechanosensitive channel
MNFLTNNNLLLSSEAAKTYINVLLTVFIAFFVNKILVSFVKVPKSFDNKRAQTYVTIFCNIITVIIYGIALHIILAELGVNIAPLLASSAIAGVVIGIGARPIIEDLLSGLFLISQSIIAVGDYIKIDDIEGIIENIGFRTMTIRAGNGSFVIIPNGSIKRIINFSGHKSNVFIDFPIKSNQKIDVVLQAANEALEKLKREEEWKEHILSGSKVDGITNFAQPEQMILTVTLVTPESSRFKVCPKYRYYAKKAFEKYEIVLS